FEVEGPRARDLLQSALSNDIDKIAIGEAQYTLLTNAGGGIVDDLIVYRTDGETFLIVVNASNVDKDLGWFQEQAGALCEIVNRSDETGLLAVQGPRAVALVQSLADRPVDDLRSFTFREAVIGGVQSLAARTGYTGEDGFELFAPAGDVGKLWDALLDAGARVGLKPIGLGARDTLRLEAKLSLYGNDLDEEHTPHEAGLSWVVKGKGFIGEAALAKQKAEGVTRKLVGFIMKERGTARHGYSIVDSDGKAVGVVTSGSLGPTVGVNIGLGYVPAALAQAGTRLHIDCRGKSAAAEVVNGPFYKRRS
ncbi:MAG TPA: glycine cleavage system aminomethyltransferase GcvT, partial [Polyangia bacterium]